jgi:hypothetical protein
LLSLGQYFFKRRQNGEKLKELANSDFAEEMKKVITQKFNE